MSSRPKCRTVSATSARAASGLFRSDGDRMADRCAAFFGQCFRLRTSAAITECNFRACGGEHANGGGANAARTARDESDFARERKRDGHSRLVSRFPAAVASGGGISLRCRKTCVPTSVRAAAGAPACRRSGCRSFSKVRRAPARVCARPQTTARSPCWRRRR